MWVKCGMILKAAEEAVRAKDLNALELLRGKAGGSGSGGGNVGAEIERMIGSLRGKRG